VDLRDDLRFLHAGDDLEFPTAAGAVVDLDAKHTFESPGPVHRHVTRRRRLGRISGRLLRCPHAKVPQRHRRAQFAVRSKHAVEPGQVHARRRYQRRQPRNQVQGLEHDVRSAIPGKNGAFGNVEFAGSTDR
jgi:hypothetical protein